MRLSTATTGPQYELPVSLPPTAGSITSKRLNTIPYLGSCAPTHLPPLLQHIKPDPKEQHEYYAAAPAADKKQQEVQQQLGSRWMEYQGIQNWYGLLDPLDDKLRHEILRYGRFVHAAYHSFDFDRSSPTYAASRFPKATLLHRCGLPPTGYRLTKNLRATSGIQLPPWIHKITPSCSWIGFVAVCQDRDEISRLGRRDIVISYRGTATGLEWLENLRATLTHFPGGHDHSDQSGPMVEKGFSSLYTSGTRSLRDIVRAEISRLLQSYGHEPLSLTITGHSLGAALAILTAYDIKTTFQGVPLMVTVMSFGGPRVGNRSFRRQLEERGAKVLRIVNSDDLITKVPGFVTDDDDQNDGVWNGLNMDVAGLPNSWIHKRAKETQWDYAEVGEELRLRSKDSPFPINSINVARSHELDTYLHLVMGS